MIACNGWLDVLLYATTRADIVFTAYPPSDNIGLETFAFMGKGHTFGTVTTVEAGPGGASRLGSGRRSQGGDSVENLYGLDKIKVKGEVTVSVDDGRGMRQRTAEHSTAETENSWDRSSRKSSQT